MAENEILHILNHSVWKRTRQLLVDAAPADHIADEIQTRLEKTLRKIRPRVVQQVLEVAQGRDTKRLNELIRGLDGVEADFAKQARAECHNAADNPPKATLANIIGLIQHQWLDQFRYALEKFSPADRSSKERIWWQVRTRLATVRNQWIAALQPDKPSLTFPKRPQISRRSVRPNMSILDKTMPAVRERLNENPSRNR